jgi:hypothetical protein
MTEEGELHVTAKDAQQTRSQGRAKANGAAEEVRSVKTLSVVSWVLLLGFRRGANSTLIIV